VLWVFLFEGVGKRKGQRWLEKRQAKNLHQKQACNKGTVRESVTAKRIIATSKEQKVEDSTHGHALCIRPTRY
jgi:hypothetical protein